MYLCISGAFVLQVCQQWVGWFRLEQNRGSGDNKGKNLSPASLSATCGATCWGNTSINSKLQHPPLATSGHLNFWRFWFVKIPPSPGAKIVFKCPTQFWVGHPKSATVIFYILTKLQNQDRVDLFFIAPFARRSELFTLNSPIFKDITLVFRWRDLPTSPTPQAQTMVKCPWVA